MLMRRVHFFVTEHAAGRDHLERRLQVFETTHLHRRCVRAQQSSIAQPERILHIACRMIGGDIELVEVVLFEFDFGSIEHRESHRREKLFQFLLHLRDGMDAAGARAGRGLAQIQPFGIQARVQRLRFERAFAGVDTRFQILLGRVQLLAELRAFLRRELAERLADLVQLAFAAQKFDADFVD